MKITDIVWDCEELDQDEIGLPSEVEVPDEVEEDEIADWLSDEYGWCVVCFSMPLTDEMSDEFGEYVNEVEARVS